MAGTLLDILGGTPETPEERAQALANALRKKQAAGTLGMLSGDTVLGGYGRQQAQSGNELALERSLNAQRMADIAAQRQNTWAAGQAAQEARRTAEAPLKQASLEASTEAKRLGTERLRARMAGAGAAQAAKVADRQKKEAAAGVKSAEALRKGFDRLPEVLSFKAVDVSFDKIKSTLQSPKPSAAQDMAAIFSYMKMLDPGSTVREGEYASARNTTGIPSQILNTYNQAASGNLLNSQQRGEFLAASRSFYSAHRKRYDTQAARYRRMAEAQGINPDDVAELGEAEDPGTPPIPKRETFTLPSGEVVEVGD